LFHAFERRALDGQSERRCNGVDILWILLIVILVLALLGFFSRGYW
jgi:flagellar basal body-associated protein FliL